MAVQTQLLPGYLLPEYETASVSVEGSTAWMYDCTHFLPLLFEPHKRLIRIPFYDSDIAIAFDTLSIQTFQFATLT